MLDTETWMKKLIIPADLYDYHELVSEAYGGIGHSNYRVDSQIPCCLLGQLYCIEDHKIIEELTNNYLYDKGHNQCFYSTEYNDEVFDKATEDRISWQEYCKRRNIVRGE